MFEKDFAALGICPGDTVMMHSSMKSLGTTMTPEAFLDELQSYLGPEGTLMLPAFSYETVTVEHPDFDIRTTEACTGLLTRTFRRMPGVIRSEHPTHSVCARGKLAAELTKDHPLDETPVGKHSPISRLADVGGKILLVGVRENITFMHGVEELAHAPYTMRKTKTLYRITGYDGVCRERYLYGHNFKNVRQCYDRAENILSAPELRIGNIGKAECRLYDAAALRRAALETFRKDVFYFVDVLGDYA